MATRASFRCSFVDYGRLTELILAFLAAKYAAEPERAGGAPGSGHLLRSVGLAYGSVAATGRFGGDLACRLVDHQG